MLVRDIMLDTPSPLGPTHNWHIRGTNSPRYITTGGATDKGTHVYMSKILTRVTDSSILILPILIQHTFMKINAAKCIGIAHNILVFRSVKKKHVVPTIRAHKP